MGNEIALTQQNTQVRPILPMNIEDAFRLAKAFAMAEMLPKSYMTGSIEKAQSMAFTAMQLGAEVGMSPMQSIQSIAVINGMPSIWGDAQKALILNSGLCEYIKETYVGDFPNDDFKAVCTVKRKGQDEVVEEFSIADAKRAALWAKPGPWTQYPKRMLKYRPRSFALRDTFPDVLKGLTHSAEEMEGVIDVTPAVNKPLKQKKERKQATEINEILAAQIDDTATTPTQQEAATIAAEIEVEVDSDGVVQEQKELLPVETVNEPLLQNAARKRMEDMKYIILSIPTAAKLREYVKANETHIIVMPEELADELQTAIADAKTKLGISPAEELLD